MSTHDDQAGTKGRVAVLCGDLSAPGGAERLVFEEVNALRSSGLDVILVSFTYSPDVTFSGRYGTDVTVIEVALGSPPRRFVSATWGLFRFLRSWRPDIVVAISPNDCVRLFLPALLTRTRYITHINGTQFWFPPEQDLTKYSWRYRGIMRRIFEVSPGHEEFVPRSIRGIGPVQRVHLEVSAFLQRLAVRHARQRITFSRRMVWEVELIYRRPALSLKGAFPESILDYEPAADPPASYRTDGGPVFLNINRLEPRKRVSLLIDAFLLVLSHVPDAVLLIGGVGPSQDQLLKQAQDRDIDHRVQFLGFIEESDLWDWVATSDVFVHPNWAEFAIAPYEALALGANVVWSTEMELDPVLEDYPHVFPAAPNVEAMAEQMMRALQSHRAGKGERARLREFTWERYFSELRAIIDREMAAQP